MRDEARKLAELEKANARLTEELALYRDAVEHMHQGLCMFTPDGRVAVSNGRYEEILQLPVGSVRAGVTGAEMIRLGMDAGHYPTGKSLEEIRAEIRADLGREDGPSATMIRGGRTYAVKHSRTAGGHLVTTCEDITPQITAEGAVRESEAQLRAILDTMPDCVKIFDAAGALIHINPKGLELLEAPDLESLSAPGYAPCPPEYMDRVVDVHRRVIAGESAVWAYELVGLRGRRRHVEAHSVPFRMPDGTRVHLSITRDIDARQAAHEALRRSEERLRLVHEATGLADFETDAHGVSTCSEAFFTQCGLPPSKEKVVFEDWLELVHPDDQERLMTEVAKALLDQGAFGCQFRLIRADTGEVRWISSRTRVERDQRGQVVRTIGAHLDITEHKRAEEALRASEERLRLVHEATGLADFETDADGFSTCSDRFFEQFGLPVPDNVIHASIWLGLLHPDDRERLNHEIEASLARADEWFRSEFRITRADTGETRWIACSTRMEHAADGSHTRSIGAHLDITERKRNEEALRESEERLRLVQEATGLGDFEAGPDGMAHLSDQFRAQIGLSPDVTTLSLEEWLRLVHPEDREFLRQSIELSLERNETFDCEFRILRADTGEVRWISSRTKMDRDEAGRAIRSIGAHLDITDRKLAEDALRESEERFRLAAEAAGLGV